MPASTGAWRASAGVAGGQDQRLPALKSSPCRICNLPPGCHVCTSEQVSEVLQHRGPNHWLPNVERCAVEDNRNSLGPGLVLLRHIPTRSFIHDRRPPLPARPARAAARTPTATTLAALPAFTRGMRDDADPRGILSGGPQSPPVRSLDTVVARD